MTRTLNIKRPWQRGRKGSLCDKEARALAKELLEHSVLNGRMRYAVHKGKAYCAKEHAKGRWHGHPVGWVEVPANLRWQWVKEKRVKKTQLDRYWEGHK